MLPKLGFGLSGPHGSPLVPEALSRRLIHQALEGGANMLDTAPFYGDAEVRLGRALKSCARKVIYSSTKLGKRRQGGIFVADFSPAALRAQVEASLKSLNVECADILSLHGPPVDLSDETRKTFLGFKTEGKARALGICGRGEEIEPNCQGVDLIMAPCVGPGPVLAAKLSLGFLGIEAWPHRCGRASRRPLATYGAWRVALDGNLSQETIKRLNRRSPPLLKRHISTP